MVLGDFLVIDVGTVGAAEVLDEGIVADGEDIDVFAADRQVIEVDVAARFATDLHVALPEFDVVDDIVVKLDDEFVGHVPSVGGRPVGFFQQKISRPRAF